MTSILKVSEIQDPTNSNTALTIDSAGNVTAGNLASPGHVIQVVNATSTTGVEVSGSTLYTAVNPSVTITPSSSSSKILIMHNAGGMVYSNTLDIRFKMFRNGTEILVINRYGYKDGTSQWAPCPFAVTFLDSPATTSACAYTFMVAAGSTGGQWRHADQGGSASSIALEIAG